MFLLWRLVRVVVLAYAGYAVLLVLVQRMVLFPGTRMEPGRTAAWSPPGVQQVWLDVSFGRVESWFLPAPSADPGPILIVAHGNAELIDDWADPMLDVAMKGTHLLLVEFPGYGHSDGAPTRATLAEAYQAAFDWAASQPQIDSSRVGVWGRSLGGGVVTDLVRERPVSAIILQSTFSSLASLAWENFRVPGLLVRDGFDNKEVVSDFSGPVLLLHGASDEIIPFHHAEQTAAARVGLSPVVLRCGHNDCSRVWTDVVLEVSDFLTAHGLLERSNGAN